MGRGWSVRGFGSALAPCLTVPRCALPSCSEHQQRRDHDMTSPHARPCKCHCGGGRGRRRCVPCHRQTSRYSARGAAAGHWRIQRRRQGALRACVPGRWDQYRGCAAPPLAAPCPACLARRPRRSVKCLTARAAGDARAPAAGGPHAPPPARRAQAAARRAPQIVRLLDACVGQRGPRARYAPCRSRSARALRCMHTEGIVHRCARGRGGGGGGLVAAAVHARQSPRILFGLLDGAAILGDCGVCVRNTTTRPVSLRSCWSSDSSHPAAASTQLACVSMTSLRTSFAVCILKSIHSRWSSGVWPVLLVATGRLDLRTASSC